MISFHAPFLTEKSSGFRDGRFNHHRLCQPVYRFFLPYLSVKGLWSRRYGGSISLLPLCSHSPLLFLLPGSRPPSPSLWQEKPLPEIIGILLFIYSPVLLFPLRSPFCVLALFTAFQNRSPYAFLWNTGLLLFFALSLFPFPWLPFIPASTVISTGLKKPASLRSVNSPNSSCGLAVFM